jgi:hypothetical protein
MTPEIIASVAGLLLSLAFAYFPGLKGQYDTLDSGRKAQVMALALFAVSAGALALSCVGWFSIPITCDKVGVETMVKAFLAALVANQGSYMLFVRPYKKDKTPTPNEYRSWLPPQEDQP